MEPDPPTTLPRGQIMLRPPSPGSGSVSYPQLTLGLGTSLPKPLGIWIQGLRSRPPASITHSEMLGFSVSRAASTHPADPAPATTTSNSASNPGFVMIFLLRGLERAARYLPAKMLSLYRIFPPFSARA